MAKKNYPIVQYLNGVRYVVGRFETEQLNPAPACVMVNPFNPEDRERKMAYLSLDHPEYSLGLSNSMRCLGGTCRREGSHHHSEFLCDLDCTVCVMTNGQESRVYP